MGDDEEPNPNADASAEGGIAAEGKKIARARSAWMLFLADNRDKVGYKACFATWEVGIDPSIRFIFPSMLTRGRFFFFSCMFCIDNGLLRPLKDDLRPECGE